MTRPTLKRSALSALAALALTVGATAVARPHSASALCCGTDAGGYEAVAIGFSSGTGAEVQHYALPASAGSRLDQKSWTPTNF